MLHCPLVHVLLSVFACKLSRIVTLVLANNADGNKRRVNLGFLTCDWNAVISNITSSLAPDSDFYCKWNAP